MSAGRQEAMRATSVMRFAIFGALGFGVGGTIAGACWPLAFVTSGASALLFILSGAVGGASLGLALKDRRRTMSLAVLGIMGFSIGGIVALLIAFGMFAPIPALSGSVDYGVRGVMGALGGAVVGGSLGLAFRDGRRVATLAVAGAVGFGTGVIVGAFCVGGIFGENFLVGISGTIILYALTGIIGGASLGAALGYLESRKLVVEQRPRVR
jgi:hypothetical protein